VSLHILVGFPYRWFLVESSPAQSRNTLVVRCCLVLRMSGEVKSREYIPHENGIVPIYVQGRPR
jgi:hypothetical protein